MDDDYAEHVLFDSPELTVHSQVYGEMVRMTFTTTDHSIVLRLPREVAYSMANTLEEKAGLLDPYDDFWYRR